MISNVSCPVCGSSDINSIFAAKSYPALIFPVDEEHLDRVPQAELEVSRCCTCTHEFQPKFNSHLAPIIYKDLYRFYPYLSSNESFNFVYRDPFLEAYRLMIASGSGGTLLEIGCGSLEALSDLDAPGILTVGVSPEVKNDSEGRLITGFFEDLELKNSYSYLVSRFSLEHIVDLQNHLNKMYSILRPDGKVLVQVPNIEAFKNNGVFHYFAHEHPQYFTQTSLSLLFGNNGFSLDSISSRESPSLILQASKIERNHSKASDGAVRTSLADFVTAGNSTTVFYGASLNLAGLLYGESRAVFSGIQVVDDNSDLWGRFMPATAITIKSPQELIQVSGPVNVLLLLNAAYHDKLVVRLKKWNPEAKCFATKLEAGRIVCFEI